MLEDLVKEMADAKLASRNLKYALLGVGYSILASLAHFLALDSIKPRSGQFWFTVLMAANIILTIVSITYGFIACQNSARALKTGKNVKNYVAFIIGGLLIVGVLSRLFGLF